MAHLPPEGGRSAPSIGTWAGFRTKLATLATAVRESHLVEFLTGVLMTITSVAIAGAGVLLASATSRRSEAQNPAWGWVILHELGIALAIAGLVGVAVDIVYKHVLVSKLKDALKTEITTVLSSEETVSKITRAIRESIRSEVESVRLARYIRDGQTEDAIAVLRAWKTADDSRTRLANLSSLVNEVMYGTWEDFDLTIDLHTCIQTSLDGSPAILLRPWLEHQTGGSGTISHEAFWVEFDLRVREVSDEHSLTVSHYSITEDTRSVPDLFYWKTSRRSSDVMIGLKVQDDRDIVRDISLPIDLFHVQELSHGETGSVCDIGTDGAPYYSRWKIDRPTDPSSPPVRLRAWALVSADYPKIELEFKHKVRPGASIEIKMDRVPWIVGADVAAGFPVIPEQSDEDRWIVRLKDEIIAPTPLNITLNVTT